MAACLIGTASITACLFACVWRAAGQARQLEGCPRFDRSWCAKHLCSVSALLGMQHRHRRMHCLLHWILQGHPKDVHYLCKWLRHRPSGRYCFVREVHCRCDKTPCFDSGTFNVPCPVTVCARVHVEYVLVNMCLCGEGGGRGALLVEGR